MAEHIRFCFIYSRLMDDAVETVTSPDKRVVIGSNPILSPSYTLARVRETLFLFLSKWRPERASTLSFFVLKFILL